MSGGLLLWETPDIPPVLLRIVVDKPQLYKPELSTVFFLSWALSPALTAPGTLPLMLNLSCTTPFLC